MPTKERCQLACTVFAEWKIEITVGKKFITILNISVNPLKIRLTKYVTIYAAVPEIYDVNQDIKLRYCVSKGQIIITDVRR